ncbi:hypothetical protein [Epilithonimonas lactis]|uniref:SGNH/GDSL hydrolase family protein n=1 Tax=Epilithonimonas lactis TaxID=421072 RepID=A0A085BJX9_9FLAO|nr:hypothetical protein [Epilithonimonas lactis]KFC22774.1 hypothetical protein IO89_06895 [Epilithonimonas lactis]SEQ86768.1 hypothetical protein SAMN04488097_3298 [Epilithonimonas lactis]
MKKFISNLFIFLMIVFLFNAVVFVFANDNYYKGYKEFPNKKYHSFIMADSHGMPLDQFAEKFEVYNFSSNSDSYFDIKRKINYLIENRYKVKTIYITVDGHTLSPYRDANNNTDKSIIYTSEITPNYIKEKYLKYYSPILQLKVNPLFRNYLEQKVENLVVGKKDVSNDIIWSKLSKKEQIKRSEERVAGQFPTKNRSQKLEKTLLEIIQLCKVNGIELIGIKFPASETYLKIVGKRNYGADQLFLSNGLKVIDYELSFINNDDYFGDQDHLNPKGGEAFVEKLLK